MKQKAVVMATAFTMLLAVGVTGAGRDSIHQHPAYLERSAMLIEQLIPSDGGQFLLPEPNQEIIK